MNNRDFDIIYRNVSPNVIIRAEKRRKVDSGPPVELINIIRDNTAPLQGTEIL